AASQGATPAAQGNPGTWLVMLYQDADDETLEQDIFIDLNEAELVGSTDKVTIVAQIDLLDGGFGGGHGTGAKRYLVGQDGDLDEIRSEELADLGEVDMGDKDTLVDFAVWAMQTYPAEKHALILSDHGMGWLGGWTDDDPNEGSQMTMEDIDRALQEITERTGVGQLELVGFDACLMAQVESLSAIAPHARYAVASEETEPALGWAYAAFLTALTEDPAMGGAELARIIVESYIDEDVRIVDDGARRAFVEECFGAEDDIAAEEVAREMGVDVTLTAVDLSQMGALNARVNDLVLALAAADPGGVAAARAYAQTYEDVFGKEDEPSFIDLGHFAALAAEETGDDGVAAAAKALAQQIAATVVATRHGPERPGSTGLSVFFPNSALYEATFMGELDYVSGASRFAAASLWDDLLTAFYTGKAIDPGAADLTVLQPTFPVQDVAALAKNSKPAADVKPAAPAAGGVTVQPLELSAGEIPADGTVTISTTVSGANVAYIYIYTTYYSEEDDAFLTADVDFIAAGDVKQVGGVTYPNWGSGGEIPIEIDWEPTVYYLSDGNEDNDQFALFEPQVYGATPAEDVYVVYGQYASGGKSKPREARLEFDGNGKMRSLLVFTSGGGAGAPRQVTPKPGDTFTVWDEWLEYDAAAEDWTYSYYEGGTMTFGKKPLKMVAYEAFAGQYQVGIVVEDLDGNRVAEYAEVTVTE
ncbi:MAG TPA: clostripain-related cysteine peptidase, partial [Anaerolineae bacterium]|nr:clostripain-related cysteine peptidase [Anaerolineae bacterium]HPL27031.1 clostripain-related cysteine peptidase [Anaerolineae bacterium]